VCAQALGNAVRSIDARPVTNAPLGAMLAEARAARGLSARALAAAVGAAPSTVTRIERSERRVSPAMLASLAAALSPDDPEALRTALTSAAGPLLVGDTPGGVRRRERRMGKAQRAARLARNRQAVADFRRRAAMQRKAAQMMASAYELLDQPSGDLEQVDALMEGSRQLQAEAGPPIGSFYEQQLIASVKAFGRAASIAAGNAPKKRRHRPRRPSLAEPARDGTASERDVLAYIRQMAQEELGVEYD
jgi:transcriptional regulator with XRE-family HTH domain